MFERVLPKEKCMGGSNKSVNVHFLSAVFCNMNVLRKWVELLFDSNETKDQTLCQTVGKLVVITYCQIGVAIRN